jgi:hypothetical protein
MSVNIKNREVETLLAELKQATGLGVSRIVLDLLRREADRVRRQRSVGVRRRRIVGYDETGLPE